MYDYASSAVLMSAPNAALAAVTPKTVFVAFQLVSEDNDEEQSPVVFSHENVTEFE